MSDSAHGQMAQFMAHHDFMKPDVRKDEPAKLGVAISAISQADLNALSLEYGVRIQDVLEGSVAENAGIEAGDVVTEIDGRPAYSPERLQYLVAEAAGASTIVLLRNKESLRLQAEFSRPEPDTAGGRAVLGIRIQEMTNELKEAFGTEGDAGVLVSQVLSGSAAKKAGLKAGDVIVSIGGDAISAVADVHGVLGGYSPGETLDVAIVRDRQAKMMQIALGSASHAGQPHAMYPRHGQQGHGNYGHGYGYHGSNGNMPWHGGGCHMGKGQRSS
jgi:S1-C subfamily serine protease